MNNHIPYQYHILVRSKLAYFDGTCMKHWVGVVVG